MKTIILIESTGIPGMDMRLKLSGPPDEMTVLLMGAMQVDPLFREVVKAAVDFFPEWNDNVDAQIARDFKGNIQQ